MDSHVGVLELTIRASPGAPGEIGSAAEAFAVEVLRRSDDILSARFPGRVWLLRRLDLSLRLVEGALADEGEIDAFAMAIAEELEQRASAVFDTIPTDPGFAVFSDETVWRAVQLEAQARGVNADGWGFEPRGSPDPLRALIDGEDRSPFRRICACLHRRGTLASTLAAQPDDVMLALAGALGMPRDLLRSRPACADGELPEPLSTCVRELGPAESPARVWLRVWTAAIDALGSHASDDEVSALAEEAFRSWASPRRASVEGAADDSIDAAAATIPTGFGGAFYLLSLALELSLGESLWRACLSEGGVLARALGLLLGARAADDPVASLFGGAQAREPLPLLLPEQGAEVSLAMLAALLEAAPRRGLAMFPHAVIQRVESAAGGLLVTTDRSSPYAFFARPADSPEQTQEALDLFFTIWPASAPTPQAARGLAGFDRASRLRARPPLPDSDLVLAEAGSLDAVALLTQTAGMLGHLFSARVGLEPSLPETLVDRYLAIPAGVLVEPGRMQVRMAMDRLDLEVRRAGLDADPGWVPWLERQVGFTYVDDRADEAGRAAAEE